MTTKLDGRLKRELSLGGNLYTLTISPDGLSLVPKGKRRGYDLAWIDLVSGDAALATALNASLAHGPNPGPLPTKPPIAKPRAKKSKASR